MAREIVGVQYMRGLAALAVVVDHAAATVASPRYFADPVLGGALYAGVVGVDLFFLISGFVITVVSLDRDWRPTLHWRAFFTKRFVRIVPLMWLAIVSYGALRLLGRGEIEPAALLRALVLSPIGTLEPLHIWTLRHEAIFYAVFALAMLGPRWLRPLLPIWCLLPFVGALGHFPELVEKLAWPTNIEFGLGVLVGLAWLKRPATVPLPQPVLLATAAMAALMMATAATGHHFHLLQSTLLTGLLALPVLLLGVYAACPAGPLDRAGRALGDASYSIYLFHPHIMSAVALVWAKAAPATPPWISIPGIVLAATGGGLVVRWLVEKPLLGALKPKAPAPAPQLP